MSLETFREYMWLKPTEYAEFKDLNKFTISSPVARINESEVSDILVEVVFTREDRKVATVQFLVSPKKQTMLDHGDDPAFRFAQVPVALAQQKKYLAEHTAEEIRSSIERVNEYAAEQEAKGKSVNLGGLNRTAKEQGWGKDFESKKALLAEKAALAEKRSRAEHEKRLTEKRREEGDAADREIIWQAFLDLPQEAREEVINICIGDNKFIRNSYEKVGPESPLLRTKIIAQMRERAST